MLEKKKIDSGIQRKETSLSINMIREDFMKEMTFGFGFGRKNGLSIGKKNWCSDSRWKNEQKHRRTCSENCKS